MEYRPGPSPDDESPLPLPALKCEGRNALVPGQGLGQLCQGILQNLQRQANAPDEGVVAVSAHLRAEMERQLVPRLEEGLRCVAEKLRRDLAFWGENLRELESLCDAGNARSPNPPVLLAEGDTANVATGSCESCQVTEDGDAPPLDRLSLAPPTAPVASEADSESLNLGAGIAPEDGGEVGLTFDAGAPLESPPMEAAREGAPHAVVMSTGETTEPTPGRPYAESCFRHAQLCRQRGDLTAAVAAYTEALEADPTFEEAYLERGQSYRQRTDVELAIADFTAALQVNVTSAEAYLRRGNAHMDLNRVPEAIDDYTHAIELAPDNGVSWMNRALAQAKRGEWNSAISDATDALKCNLQLGGAYFIRAAALARVEAYDRALADLDTLIHREPGNVLAHNERGLVLAARGDFSRAIASYAEALRLRPKFALARFNRAVALRLKGDFDLALAEFNRLVRLMPRNAAVYYQRGLAWFARHDSARAIADFDRALCLNPELTDAREAAREVKKSLDGPRVRPLPQPGNETPVRIVPKAPPPPTNNAPVVPDHVPLQCLACGARGQIRVDQLAHPFQCRACKRRYRVQKDGQLAEILPPPSVMQTVRRFAPNRARTLRIAAAFLLLGLLGWGVWRLAKPEPLPPLPNELNARAELMGKAWASKDLVLMRRLTAPERGRALHRWLNKHPSPELGGELSPAQLLRHAQVDVAVTDPNDDSAQLNIKITTPTGSSAEMAQQWFKEADTWFFAPSDPREVPRKSMRLRRSTR